MQPEPRQQPITVNLRGSAITGSSNLQTFPDSKLVPSPQLEIDVQLLLQECPELDIPAGAAILVLTTKKPVKKNGRIIYGKIHICNEIEKLIGNWDLILTLDRTLCWENRHLPVIHELLCSVFYDNEGGQFVSVPFDMQAYSSNIKKYGDWRGELGKLKIAETLHQLNLLDNQEE